VVYPADPHSQRAGLRSTTSATTPGCRMRAVRSTDRSPTSSGRPSDRRTSPSPLICA